MGYYMEQTDSHFVIRAEKVNDAIASLRALARTRYLSWIGAAGLIARCDAGDFERAMEECRWRIRRDSCGNVCDIDFYGEKSGSDFEIFNAIAPHVESGSFIEMRGEDNAIWRWFFWKGKCIEEEPEIKWPSDTMVDEEFN